MSFKFGHGSTNLWGYSSAVDLVSKISLGKKKNLILGENDGRNLFTTISKLGFKSQDVELEFTIGETSVTGITRIILLFF